MWLSITPDADMAAAMARYQQAMSPLLAWDAERDVGSTFKVPLVVMQGDHDWQTNVDLARAYFGKVCAPYKKWVAFPHSAHALNIEQPGLSVVALVKPATVSGVEEWYQQARRVTDDEVLDILARPRYAPEAEASV